MEVSELNQLIEKLRVVKKKWKTNFPGFKVEYNDDIQSHDLIPRIKERTDMKLNEIGKKVSEGIEYIINKLKRGWELNSKRMIEIEMKKSKFKVLYLVDPRRNKIRVSTILAPGMRTKNTIKWDLQENTQADEKIVLDI